MWEVEGDVRVRDPKSPVTALYFAPDTISHATLTVVYRGTCCVVGGVGKPTNSFLVLARYLVLAGLVTVGAAVCLKKRYH